MVKDHIVIGDGYNGFPRGTRGCLDGGCPRGQHYPDDQIEEQFTLCGGCREPWPCPEAVEPGSSYDTGPGFCGSVHAEINCLLNSNTSWAERQGAAMYVNTEPCIGCLKIIACSGIIRVVWPGNQLTFPFLSCYHPA